MLPTDNQTKRTRPAWRRWLHRAFILWAAFATAWLANSYRTQGVDPAVLQSGTSVTVRDGTESLQFLPPKFEKPGLIFLCGSGVAAAAYAPLLRPLAESGYPVFIIKLPCRFAPLESHKLLAIERVRQVMAEHPSVSTWVLSGHSLGGALACRIARESPSTISAMVLVGTTHPRDFSLASVQFPVAKVCGSTDGVAPIAKIDANRELLPDNTNWVLIDGGNHSQFGHYGHQLFDGTATVSRTAQQVQTRLAIVEMLESVSD